MKLTHHADYALRTLVYVGTHTDELVTTAQVAEAFGISRHHLHKVISELGRLGWLEVKRGVGGGMRLACDPAEVRLGQVVRQLDHGSAPLVECFDGERNQCVIAPACAMKGALAKALDAFYAVLDEQTLADVLAGARKAKLAALIPRS
jgi:Rrf2 family nitric oxide-sensitive transcriptional repressor